MMVLLSTIVVLLHASQTLGHGRLMEPPARKKKLAEFFTNIFEIVKNRFIVQIQTRYF